MLGVLDSCLRKHFPQWMWVLLLLSPKDTILPDGGCLVRVCEMLSPNRLPTYTRDSFSVHLLNKILIFHNNTMKIIEVIADESYIDSIKNIADKNDASDFWVVSSEDEERKVVRILVKPEQRQIILDALQEILSTSLSARVVVISVEATLPREEELEKETKKFLRLKQRAKSYITVLVKTLV